jgi:hypothetical protein
VHLNKPFIQRRLRHGEKEQECWFNQ